MFVVILRWWLALLAVGLLGLPLTTWLFRYVPGRGLAFSKILGTLVIGFVAWLLAMLGFGGFGLGTVLVGCAALLGAGIYAARLRPADLRPAIRAHWQSWLAWELLFSVMLGIGVWLRLHGAYGSQIFATEKPMELMFLNSVLTSPAFPPQDLWLAGYSINYYYLGYVLVGALTALSGVAVGAAFNLGVATLLAFTALGCAGIVAALIGSAQAQGERLPNGRARWARMAAALAAVVLVLLTGNQLGALQRIVGSSQVNALSSSQRVSVLMQALSGQEPRTLDPATVKAPLNSATLQPMNGFDWWAPSRAIYDDTGSEQRPIDGQQREVTAQFEVITEFPFFSFYLGDMHPHVLALPWVLLALALALALLHRPAPPAWLADGRSRLELALTGLSIGSLYAINSWDAPTYGALYAGALALLYHRSYPEHTLRTQWKSYARTLGLVVLAALVLFSPFLVSFTSFAGRSDLPPAIAKIPVIRTIGRIIGPALDHTSWSDFVVIFGLFLVPLGAWWASQVPAQRRWVQWAAVGGLLLVGVVLEIPALACAPLAYLLLRSAWRNADQTPRAFALLVGGFAILLLFVVDFVYLRDNFDKRFNTVFKVYYQVWLLLGTLAAFALWSLLAQGRWRHWRTAVWGPLFALLLVGAFVYPYSVVSPATAPGWDVPRVIDGLENSGYYNQQLRAAAAWLKANAAPRARIVSNVGDSYQAGGEIAALSGRPTLLAWPSSHESLWRSKQPDASAQVGQRRADVQTIYTSADVAQVRALLDQYKVDYIVVGPNEQQSYPGLNTATLDQLATRVFDQDGWAIYQVKR